MNSIHWRVLTVISAVALSLAGCSLIPLQILGSGTEASPPPIELMRCDDIRDVLCLMTFGLEPPDSMVVTLLTVPGLPVDLTLHVTYQDEPLHYECESTVASPTVVYCTGPQIPLGSRILIEVFSSDGKVLLASGEFTLMALALPTAPVGGVAFPTPVAPFTPLAPLTPTPFFIPTSTAQAGTLIPRTAYPNLTPSQNPLLRPSPTANPILTPGGIPNPNPDSQP